MESEPRLFVYAAQIDELNVVCISDTFGVKAAAAASRSTFKNMTAMTGPEQGIVFTPGVGSGYFKMLSETYKKGKKGEATGLDPSNLMDTMAARRMAHKACHSQP